MFRKVTAFLTLVAAVAALHSPATAQGLGDRLKGKVKERVDSKVDAGMEKALDKFEGAIRCVAGDDACVSKAAKSKKKVVLTDDEGAVLPADQQPKDSPAADPAKNPGPGSSTPPAGPAWDNFDFKPGERVLFSDDFSNDRVGNFPQRLELINGNMEVVQWNGKPWLRMTSRGMFAIKLPEALPKRFTMEFELAMPHNPLMIFSTNELERDFINRDAYASSSLYLDCCEHGVIRGSNLGSSTVDARQLFPSMFTDGVPVGRPMKVRVEVDGNYMKAYLDEKRIANIPNANFFRGNYIEFQFEGPQNDLPPYITGFSINAGGKKLYDALLADGRVATQGIFFDTNSDRIRPESQPTLKEIGEMLKDHPELKLTVEGHTDNTGTAAANQTLSEKRAQAIVARLTADYGIAAGRLVGAGLGATKPAATNATAEGRQSNRRVELVRM